jgi:penicillin amidase
MQVIKDTIHVKGADDVMVEHKYTRHGPVTLVNTKQNKAYAIRCAWLEPGGAPYLASLRMDQATTWEEFRKACTFSHIPGENMIWADQKGNIGWQAVGIAPVRKNWSGLVPVPGDGRFEWDGFLPIEELPNVANPDKGFWATANENLVPDHYAHRDAVGWSFADRYRADRINEVLASRPTHTMKEMMALQFDYVSLPARSLVPLLANLKSAKVKPEEARKKLLNWNFTLDKNSVEAAIYVAWEKKISAKIATKAIPDNVRKLLRTVKLGKVIDWVTHVEGVFNNPKERDQFLIATLEESVSELETKLGPDINQWQYGQAGYHHALIKHPLSNAVNDDIRKKLEAGPLPRGGSATTPGATTNSNNQNGGASFRIVVDTKDWDLSMFTNTPGQSGDPESPYYRNLFERWANDQHFPVYFSREKVDASAASRITLKPGKP